MIQSNRQTVVLHRVLYVYTPTGSIAIVNIAKISFDGMGAFTMVGPETENEWWVQSLSGVAR